MKRCWGMRRKRAEIVGENAVKVDLSSLVDMSFLLLVYFLVTTTLLAKEQDMPMVLPGSAGVVGNLKPITIRVEADDSVVLHPGLTFQEEVASSEEGRELPTLKDRLVMLRMGQQTVQLDVVDGAGYQRFIDVLNCLRGVGWDEVAITHL